MKIEIIIPEEIPCNGSYIKVDGKFLEYVDFLDTLGERVTRIMLDRLSPTVRLEHAIQDIKDGFKAYGGRGNEQQIKAAIAKAEAAIEELVKK